MRFWGALKDPFKAAAVCGRFRRSLVAAVVVGSSSSRLSISSIGPQWLYRRCQRAPAGCLMLLSASSWWRRPDGEPLAEVLQRLKAASVATNRQVARQLGIGASAAITCVKPSGTVSQLVDAASGIHARHAPFFVRTVRGDNKVRARRQRGSILN